VSKSSGHFGEFKAHTRLKHIMLETYFQTWARKLLLRPGAGDVLYYIDACAGPGMDDAGNHGSPILAAHEAAKARGQILDQFGRAVTVNVIAIEKSGQRFRELKKNLAPFGNHARAVRGTLAEHLPALLTEMGAAPALFFIDPFGIEPLKAHIVRAAVMRRYTEALLLFADQAALRHYGVITADVEEMGGQVDLLQEFGALYEDQEAKVLAAKAEELEPTREACEEIMSAAFADWDWQTPVGAVARSRRRQVIVDEYERMLRAAGGEYVLKIPIIGLKNRHVYHLFHATKSPAGYATMKDAVSTALRKSPRVGSAADAIRYLVRTDIDEVERLVRRQFSGQRVSWTGHGDTPSVRRWVLQNTPTYPFEMTALKKRLSGLRDHTTGKKLVINFPLVS
jgi:three-Cys-motif partner protein